MPSEAVQVIARIRPEPPGSSDDGVLEATDDKTVLLLPKPYDGDDSMASRRAREVAPKGFKVDRCFGPSSTQLEVYSWAQPLALSVTQVGSRCGAILARGFILLEGK